MDWCVDVLASRGYGSRKELLTGMYWEEFWDATIVAANTKIEELNMQMRFNFMLHADKKSQGKWKDLPIPFLEVKDKETVVDKSGISQLPTYLQGAIYKPEDKF